MKLSGGGVSKDQSSPEFNIELVDVKFCIAFALIDLHCVCTYQKCILDIPPLHFVKKVMFCITINYNLQSRQFMV